MSQDSLRSFAVFVSAPFQARLVVDHTALVGDDVVPMDDKFASLLCKQVEDVASPEIACVECCTVEYEKGGARFEGGGGGLMTGPESLVRIGLQGSFVLDKARSWGEMESLFEEVPRLESVSLSFHEYGIGILSGWLRVRLKEPLPANRIGTLLDQVETRTRDNPELLEALGQCDREVHDSGDRVLKQMGRTGRVFQPDRESGDSARPLWIHLVSVFEGRVGDDAEDPLGGGLTRRFAIVGDAEGFVNMCPSTPWFVHIGWLRSVLVAPDELAGTPVLEDVVRDTQRPLPVTDAGMILRVLRRHQVDWMAGDALNGFLARKLEKFAALRQRGPEDARMAWIERAAVEIELCEAQRSLYLQTLRPVPHQAYQRAMQIRRIQDQIAGYERKLGSLQMLYEQNESRAEARERREADEERQADRQERDDEAAHDRRINLLTGMIALLAVISAAADAVMIYVWGYSREASPPVVALPGMGNWPVSQVLLYTALAVIAVGALALGRSLRRRRRGASGA